MLTGGAIKIGAAFLREFFDQVAVTTGGTGLVDRFIPADKIALGIIGAAVKNSLVSRLFLDNITAASIFGAFDSGRKRQCGLAGGVG